MERITIEHLEGKLNSTKKVLLIAVADWCGQSRMLKQIVEKHMNDYPEVVIYEIDVEANKMWNHQVYQINKVPSLLFFNEGALVNKIEEYQYEIDFLKLLNQFKND